MEQASAARPAILFEPDGYRTDIERLMGRQSAGMGFLRAAVAAAGGAPLAGYTVRKPSAEVFARTVKEIDPQATARWLNPSRPDELQRLGHLYVPGPGLGDFARQRLRVGPHAWSITGVTHTTASHGVMDALTDLAVAPVMPWDAVICTSSAVRLTVDAVLGAQQEYLRWRFGAVPAWTLPQLPVIPLGVHCTDFEIGEQERRSARAGLGIADDEVVYLFVGRLSFHAKAHPHAMYAALQAAARETGRKLTLVQCGWFANDHIEQAFRSGAEAACPEVRCLFTDGRAGPGRRASWAAADAFVSLSDNIQETFGLTPIEAMAAALPVVVTDWDGYKDTVRDGVDGFRIPTWAPPPGAGEPLAWAHEIGTDTYDMYCGYTSQLVSVDHRSLARRLSALASDEGLRRRMGEAGRRRARELFDWTVVYRAYEALWAELDRLRPKEPLQGVPRASPARLDPFFAFGHYPTERIGRDTLVRCRAGASAQAYAALARMPLYSFGQKLLPPQAWVGQVLAATGGDGLPFERLCTQLRTSPAEAVRGVGALAKMGLLELGVAP